MADLLWCVMSPSLLIERPLYESPSNNFDRSVGTQTHNQFVVNHSQSSLLTRFNILNEAREIRNALQYS